MALGRRCSPLPTRRLGLRCLASAARLGAPLLRPGRDRRGGEPGVDRGLRGRGPAGPGDWACTLTVFILQPGAVPFQQTPVTYDVTVQANGCWKAQSPPSFVGQQTMRDADGNKVVNPLFVMYGCLNPL